MDQKDYNRLFTDIIQKQIAILGPDATLAKVHEVEGIIVDNNGNVTQLNGEPHALLQKLIDNFVALSGDIVKQTINPVLAEYPEAEAAMNPNNPAPVAAATPMPPADQDLSLNEEQQMPPQTIKPQAEPGNPMPITASTPAVTTTEIPTSSVVPQPAEEMPTTELQLPPDQKLEEITSSSPPVSPAAAPTEPQQTPQQDPQKEQP